MIKPGISKYNWEIELTDAKSHRTYGLKVPQGALSIGTISQDDTVYVRNVGKRAGDFDEQRSWKAGRGLENLSDNAEGFWDAANAWTLTAGHVHQAPQWYHARGLRSEDMYMPTRTAGSVKFIPLLDANTYIANSFAASASYSADKGYLWIRRRGSPASSLTFRLMSNSAGDPNAALQTVTKTITDITDYVSVYQVFDWTSTESLTSGTTYWVSIHASAAGDRDNCWEVAVDPNTNSGKISSSGSSWASAGFALYYRVTDADVAKRWFRFYMQEAMYIIDRKDDNTTASVLYINGDRGITTSTGASTLGDSTKTWTTHRWIGAWVKIIAGTGVKNRPKLIAENSTDFLTISGTWETNPDTTSEYIIYATEWFTAVSPTGGSLSVCSGEPQVANNVAYIPQGLVGICHLRWNVATPAHNVSVESATGTKGLADLLMVTNDPAAGVVMWRANNATGTGTGGRVTVSKANLLTGGAFIAWNTALVWKTGIFTGSTAFEITGLDKKDNNIYVFREDGIGVISGDQFNNVETGLEKTPDRANGRFTIAHGQFLFYSWLHSLVRIFGSSHDDIGDDYRAIGLPDGREGEYVDGDTYLKLLFVGVDAGSTGTSSVLAWDGLGWHEMLRARQAGDRVRFVKIQTCAGTRNRLWTGQGGDLIFQELSYKKASPRLDSGMRYQHEAVIESGSIDMGTASAMPKLIKELTATIKNLNSNGREIYLDIQTDDDVHTTTWNYAGLMTRSPESNVFLGITCNRFAYRLRMCSNDNSIPIDIEGIVPNGYARVPFKLIFSMTVQSGGVFTRRGKSVPFDELARWLLDQSRIAGFVNMSSVYELAHGWKVIIHPPRMTPLVPKKGKNPETGTNTLVLQEV
jgi:hypothetical protein